MTRHISWKSAKALPYLLGLLLAATAPCSFAFGDDAAEQCADARKIVEELKTANSDEIADKEKEIVELCPDGPSGLFIKGLRDERGGASDKAASEFRAALAGDATMTEAHGNLGLLLQKTAPDQAAVELTMGLVGKEDPRYHAALAGILREKAPALALFHYREALKAYPSDASLHVGMARTLAATGQDDDAVKEFKAILNEDAGNIAALQGLAENLIKHGRIEDAIAVLKKGVAGTPGNTGLHRLLGRAYRLKGEEAEAEREERLAGIATDPAEYIRKGDTYLLAREYDKAVEQYQAAARARPKWQEALEKLGDAQRAAGYDEEAIVTYKQVLGFDESNSEVHYILGVLYERRGVLNEAETHYQQALRYDPGNGDSRRRLADIYTLRGNFPLAIEEYRHLISVRGDNPLLHFKLARVYQRSKKFDDAVTEFKAAIGIAPDNIEAHRELAMLYLKRKMTEEAEGQYREVLRLNKGDIDARNALTALFVRNRKFDDLVALLKEGVELAPNDPNSHYRLGLVHDYKREYDLAKEQYKEAISLKPDHAKALNALGKVYLKLGDRDKGREMLEAAKKADPNLLEARELLNNLGDDKAQKSVKVKHRGKKHVHSKKAKKGKVGKKTHKQKRKVRRK